MKRFLESTPVIDWTSPSVRDLSRTLSSGRTTRLSMVAACFEWVRDRIAHSSDHHRDRVTCSASDVLEAGTGLCYAKSHLLAALLRANGIPAGLVYQRLQCDDQQYCLHGLNAVWLDEHGWYRLDPRGPREGLVSECSPPREQLPFFAIGAGEMTFPGIWAEPVAQVLDALTRYRRTADLLENLPDATDLGGADIDA